MMMMMRALFYYTLCSNCESNACNTNKKRKGKNYLLFYSKNISNKIVCWEKRYIRRLHWTSYNYIC